MAFYAAEEISIQNDEEDNQLLKQLARKYKQLQVDYEASKLETHQLKHQIAKLEQCNAQLLKELEDLQDSLQKFNQVKKEKITVSSKPFEKGYLNMPLPDGFLRESNVGLQHTKRKVINGFVQQISSELQFNDDLLRRERKILEQTRRALSQSTQELSIVRANLREADEQIGFLHSENRQLRQQIQAQRQKSRQLPIGNVGKSKVGYEWDKELKKMDEIYRIIERELDFS